MLRITTIESTTKRGLLLEGQLTEPWVAELDSHWERMRRAAPQLKLAVDLRGVTRIDARGKAILVRMKREGAEFLASGIRTNHLLSSLDSEATSGD